jgi:hypothetical protein
MSLIRKKLSKVKVVDCGEIVDMVLGKGEAGYRFMIKLLEKNNK